MAKQKRHTCYKCGKKKKETFMHIMWLGGHRLLRHWQCNDCDSIYSARDEKFVLSGKTDFSGNVNVTEVKRTFE